MRQLAQSWFASSTCAVFVLCACSSEVGPLASNQVMVDVYLGVEVPSDGFMVRSVGAEIQPGEDVEYCEVAQLPGDPSETYYVKSTELGNASGSHHLLVSAAIPGSSVEAKLQALGVRNRVECFGAESQFGPEFISVGGSQQPYRKLALPVGVGRELRGGQLLVFDYHYFNTQDTPIDARSVVSFHLTKKSEVSHVVRDFGFYNYTIATSPMSQGSFVGECHFKEDVMLGSLSRHTHRWGTDFKVWYAGGPYDGQPIWSSHDWQHEVDFAFDLPVELRAGEGLRFRCKYDNDTTHALRFGTSATDEMCILFGRVWASEAGRAVGNQDCVITWVDTDGVGHPANEAGGFPAPATSQVNACLANAADTDCARCRCQACAAPTIQCALDSDCDAIMDCYAACPAGSDCAATCRSTIDSHSSAIGPLRQMSDCFASRCASACGG